MYPQLKLIQMQDNTVLKNLRIVCTKVQIMS